MQNTAKLHSITAMHPEKQNKLGGSEAESSDVKGWKI